MQIKPIKRAKSGPAWEFVRWTYDSASGRSKPETLGRMDQSWSAIPLPILERMTPDEKVEADAWLSTLLEGRRKAELRNMPWSLHGYAAPRLVEALEAGTVSVDDAARCWAAIDTMAKALKRAGHPRSAKAPAAPETVEPTPLEVAVAAKGTK